MREIEPSELKSKLEAGAAIDVVDIREADEFDAWHIHGSSNLPVYEALKLDRSADLVRETEGLSKDRPIVTVCRGGVVSQRAAQLLSDLGYDATSLAGGIRGWSTVWSCAPVPAAAGVQLTQVRRNAKGCLSYVASAGGSAVVIDPSVDIAAYLEVATVVPISHVLETHVHADHVSRARELCRATGAELVLPANQRVTYDYRPIRDGEILTTGGIRIEAVATPGHTLESTCYLLNDTVLLTGDTLFVDAVGRPDLERGDAGAEDGARKLYHSLSERLLGRFDDVGVYPCHHAGPIGFEPTPIGASLREIRRSLDLTQAGEDEFVARILGRLQPKPPNFDRVIAINEGKAEIETEDLLDLEAGPNRCAAC